MIALKLTLVLATMSAAVSWAAEQSECVSRVELLDILEERTELQLGQARVTAKAIREIATQLETLAISINGINEREGEMSDLHQEVDAILQDGLNSVSAEVIDLERRVSALELLVLVN